MATRIKRFEEATRELKKTIQDAKNKFIESIISDTELSKVEKLRFISDNDLFGTESYICDIFPEYYTEYLNMLMAKGVQHPCIDDYFHTREYQRHEVVNLADICEEISYEDSNDIIIIMTNRTTTDVFSISKYEFIDAAYSWCIENKSIGFEIDW